MAYQARTLEATLRRAMRTFPAVLLTGPRQSGKTTLLREVFADSHRYVSLDRPDVRARAIADPVGFLDEHEPPLILDEIQRAPEILSHLRERIDLDRRAGRWLLTGSQTFALMKGISETLAGRVAVLMLDPMSPDEIAGRPDGRGIDALLDATFGTGTREGTRGEGTRAGAADRVRRRDDLGAWILRGGFPEPGLDRRVDRQLWFSSYVQTYLERDVRDLLRVGDLDTFGRFLGLVAARSGNLLNMTDLGRDAGVTGPTVKSWLSVLEASRLLYLLPPYHANYGKRLIKSPKVFILDPGLLTFLLGLHSAEAATKGAHAGAIVESAVVTEWIKVFDHRGERPSLFFWRSSAGDEVDLIIERDGRLHGVEVKATATPTPQHAEGLARWLSLAGKSARGALACQVTRPMALRPGIRAVPLLPT